MGEINEIIEVLVNFRNERDWAQIHDSKNLAIALSIEASELNELYLWKDTIESENVDKSKVKEELADILAYALLLAEKNNFNVKEIILDKVKKNNLKYPVEKSKGTSKKYNEL
jgi:NTP pyrophosphatase (non-canonical NTP hydrolase)